MPRYCHPSLLGLALALVAALAIGANAAEETGRYRVRRGESAADIAACFGVPVANLGTTRLRAGQALTIRDPFRRTTSPLIRWRTPLSDRATSVLRPFGTWRQGRLQEDRAGVDLAARVGDAVRAPAPGRILFAGEQMGYGHMILLEHGAGFMTVLGPLAPADPRPRSGDLVRGGDMIGRVGAPVEGARPYLHLELRRHGHPLDPARILD